MDVAPAEHVACWFAQGCAAVDQLRSRTAERVEGVLGDDAELTAAVLAAQDGDEDAFRAVYRAVQPRLLGYIRTLVGEPDAEDVASEAWLQIARDLDRFSGDADRFRGWAARIARNRSLDHLRMRSRRPAIGGDETELTARAAESDTAGDAIEALDTDRTMSLIAQAAAGPGRGRRAPGGRRARREERGADPGQAARRRPHRRPPRAQATGRTPRRGTSRGEPGRRRVPADGAPAPDPAQGPDDGAGQEAGGGAGLGAVPAQRPGRGGPAAPAGVTPGVTHSRPWTQKDM